MIRKESLVDDRHSRSGLIDSMIFGPIRAATGGNLRFGMNGGGPLAKDTQIFTSTLV
jgi:long-chain acyl-CoA synthetase